MDFLLEPNVAYLVLLASVLLGFMALVSPGTGLFEVGAFFCIALAGYAVYNLSFNWWALILVLLGVIPFVYAIQKPKRELYLGLSIVLVVIGSVFVFPRTEGQAGVNLLLVITGSSLVSGFLWLAVRKSVEAASVRPTHDLDGVVGLIGEARTAVHNEGSVQVNGELWSARSDTAIPAKSKITVIRREGFVLVVKDSSSVQS
jgi:membrane-bound serine protease (ClpP class)